MSAFMIQVSQLQLPFCSVCKIKRVKKKKSATTVTWKMFAVFLCCLRRIAINYTYQQQFCSSHKHIIHLWASQALPPAANASRYLWNIPSILSLSFFSTWNDDDDEKSHVFHVFRRSVLLILRHTVEIILYYRAMMKINIFFFFFKRGG